MRLEFVVPDDLRLDGLSETTKGWRAYVRWRPLASEFRGGIGLTPQEAIDEAARTLRAQTLIKRSDVDLNLEELGL